MSHLHWELGWASWNGFDKGLPLSCPAVLLSTNSHLPRLEWANNTILKIQVNPTQSKIRWDTLFITVGHGKCTSDLVASSVHEERMKSLCEADLLLLQWFSRHYHGFNGYAIIMPKYLLVWQVRTQAVKQNRKENTAVLRLTQFTINSSIALTLFRSIYPQEHMVSLVRFDSMGKYPFPTLIESSIC